MNHEAKELSQMNYANLTQEQLNLLKEFESKINRQGNEQIFLMALKK